MMFILKGWLLFLELCMTLAILLSLGTLAIIAAVITRYPQRLVLKYEYILSAACFLAAATTSLLKIYYYLLYLNLTIHDLIKYKFIFFSAVLILLTVCLFPYNCWRRDWLMYPIYNHLSWSFYIAILSGFVHAYGAWYLYKVC